MKRPARTALVGFLAAVMATSTVAGAQAGATLTFEASADAMVTALYPTNKYGTQDRLRANASPDKTSLIRFDVTGLPTESQVTSARLVLTGLDVTQPTQTITVHEVVGPWDEAMVTYATRPALGAILGTATLTRNGTATIAIPVTGNGLVNLAITTSGTGTTDAIFGSRENPDPALRPRLEVDYLAYTEQSIMNKQTVTIGGDAYNGANPSQPHSATFRQYEDGRTLHRHELRAGEYRPGDAIHEDGRQRTELIGQKEYPLNTDLWFSYSVRWTGTMTNTWAITQLRQPNEANEPLAKPPAFSVGKVPNRAKFDIVTRSTTDPVATQPPPVTRATWDMPAAGVWQHFVGQVRFDPFGGGTLRFWVDGQQILDLTNVPIGFNDAWGPHFSFGQYRGDEAGTTTYEFANLEFGTTSLLDRVTTPKPLP